MGLTCLGSPISVILVEAMRGLNFMAEKSTKKEKGRKKSWNISSSFCYSGNKVLEIYIHLSVIDSDPVSKFFPVAFVSS